jgi:Flp pilus assembly protein TadG
MPAGLSMRTMSTEIRAGLLTRIGRFARDRRGISIIEFAFVFPVMVVLWLSGVAITQGIIIKRKVTMAVRTVGDLVSQDTKIGNNERDAILAAGTAVINPFAAGQLSVIVSSVIVGAGGAATIDWSFSTTNTTAHTAGNSVTLPTGITPLDANGQPVVGSTIIWAEGSYNYTYPVGSGILGAPSMTLSDQFYLRPRRVTKITRCNTATCP